MALKLGRWVCRWSLQGLKMQNPMGWEEKKEGICAVYKIKKRGRMLSAQKEREHGLTLKEAEFNMAQPVVTQ